MVTLPSATLSGSRTPVAIRAGLLIVAAVLVLIALSKPWWGMQMIAPQYPEGLEVTAYMNGLTGDIKELDILNHYIGMMSLNDAAKIERATAKYVVPGLALLAVVSIFINGWLGYLLRTPLILFPIFFLVDLSIWMWWGGNHLDPSAPLSQMIPPFTPTVLGAGKVAQFTTHSYVLSGFWLAFVASLLALAACFVRTPVPKGGTN